MCDFWKKKDKYIPGIDRLRSCCPKMGPTAGVTIWIYINWLSVTVLTALFLWKHTEVLQHFAPYATKEALGTGIKNSLSDGYLDWYVDRLKDGTAYWFPDLFCAYFLIPSFILLQIYMIKSDNKEKCIFACCSIPCMIMGIQMMTNLYTDTLLYLNVRPTVPRCGCLNYTLPGTALFDCQCYIPFYDGLARVLTTDKMNVTKAEFLGAGVSAEHIPSGNLSIVYERSSHDVDAINTWDIDAYVWEVSLTESCVFVVLTRLKPFLEYQKALLDADDVGLFSSVISHHYYLISECLDAFSLFEEIVEHGDYFKNRLGIVYAIVIFTMVALTHLLYSSFPANHSLGDELKKPGFMNLQQLIGKGTILVLVNIPMLVIRIYLVTLYGDEVKIGIVFMLLIIREVGMIVMGVLEVIYEYKTYKSEREKRKVGAE